MATFLRELLIETTCSQLAQWPILTQPQKSSGALLKWAPLSSPTKLMENPSENVQNFQRSWLCVPYGKATPRTPYQALTLQKNHKSCTGPPWALPSTTVCETSKIWFGRWNHLEEPTEFEISRLHLGLSALMSAIKLTGGKRSTWHCFTDNTCMWSAKLPLHCWVSCSTIYLSKPCWAPGTGLSIG